ncbi:hypothetical protein HK097_007069 [Rhizophlyctis rosea]|uniref:Clavaminate synthase-like protein n=1 Tax=Rhizophlyctis rosea TaxID=64517 RepID=A0AAD5X1V5_9FUNG|nr:hypothetical protein HK097_007069 [Rhizophlyctis rosea]
MADQMLPKGLITLVCYPPDSVLGIGAFSSIWSPAIHDKPRTYDPQYAKEYPVYGYPNIWPSELPELENAFMDLGRLIVQIGNLVARHCDAYISKSHPSLPRAFLQTALASSTTTKARLLHYFPIENQQAEASTEALDTWCGLHVDHSMLTGLTSALYIDETGTPFHEADTADPRVVKAVSEAGLYIKNRAGTYLKVDIPPDCIAFQIGEAAQVASNGSLVPTPHLVRGIEPHADSPRLARNTFAVFMQPNVDVQLTPDKTFAQFTAEVAARHRVETAPTYTFEMFKGDSKEVERKSAQIDKDSWIWKEVWYCYTARLRKE